MSTSGYVGVVGPGQASDEELARAAEVGRLLAGHGLVVVTGGLGGVMGAAAQGCAEAGGTSVGLLPGTDRDAADPHLSVALPTGLGEMRNALLVRCCDAVVAVGTSWGTLSEVALAARTGVPVVLLDGPPSLDALLGDLLDDLVDDLPPGIGGSVPVRAADPRAAVELVVGLLGLGPGPGDGLGPVPGLAPEQEHVLGVDGAAGGWVGAVLPASGRGTVRLVRAGDIRTLVAQAQALVDLELVAVDIPIGLPDTGTRRADVEVRRRLGPRASSVFPTPVRDALTAPTYAEARQVSVARTGGRSLSAQSYALRRAILDVDAFVRSDPGVRVVEVHPELSFAALSGSPLTTRKRDRAGAAERLGALAGTGIRLPDGVDATARGIDDVLDAAVAAWSAARVRRGEAERLPAEPQRFSDGIDAAMWC